MQQVLPLNDYLCTQTWTTPTGNSLFRFFVCFLLLYIEQKLRCCSWLFGHFCLCISIGCCVSVLVNRQRIDRLVSDIIRCVSSGPLNPAHSLTHSPQHWPRSFHLLLFSTRQIRVVRRGLPLTSLVQTLYTRS